MSDDDKSEESVKIDRPAPAANAIWSRWIPILTLVATTALGFFQYYTKLAAESAQRTAQASKDASEQALKDRELGIKNKEVSIKQDEAVYKYVIEAIEAVQQDKKNVHRIMLANILVNNMASESYHEPVSLVLKDFVDSVSPKGKSIVDPVTARDLDTKAEFFAKQIEVASSRSRHPAANAQLADVEPYGLWDIDFFWCQASGELAKKGAEAAVALLQSEKRAGGRIRARMLPETINSRPGYGIRGLEIRIDQDKVEASLAERMKNDLSGLLQARGNEFGLDDAEIGRGFVTRVTSQNTKWYVSAFFCRAEATAK